VHFNWIQPYLCLPTGQDDYFDFFFDFFFPKKIPDFEVRLIWTRTVGAPFKNQFQFFFFNFFYLKILFLQWPQHTDTVQDGMSRKNNFCTQEFPKLVSAIFLSFFLSFFLILVFTSFLADLPRMFRQNRCLCEQRFWVHICVCLFRT